MEQATALSGVQPAEDESVPRDVAGTAIQSRATSISAQSPDEFHSIFIRYSKPVLTFIYAMLGDRARSEDLTQETFIRAFRNFASKRTTTPLPAWLFGIARNVIREAIKQKYRPSRHLALEDAGSGDLPDGSLRPDERVINAELHDRIQIALDGLSEDQRIVFVLKIVQKMRYDDIAKITGYSVGKLKTDLHRARAEMRQRLQPYLSGDDSIR